MGRYLLGFVLSFLLILPLQAKDNECGLNEDGTVSDYSFEVCEEDKAFSMLYSIMPEVFDNNLFNVFDLGEVENLKNSPEILYDKQFNRFTPILVVIISSVLDLTILFASFFIAYKSFWSLLTAIQRGDFIADRQISPKTLFIIGFLISISLVKVFDLVMIQVLVLLMAMAAISIANFMFSAFLSSVEKKNYASEDIEIDRVDIQQNHNDSIARNYITSLTKMALCREITSQYIMSMNASMINNDNYEESKNCSAGIDGIGVSNQVFSDTDLLDNNKPYPTFISHDLSPFDHKWDQEVASTYQVSFGISKPKTCDIDTFIDYQCGSITTVLPTINDNALLKAIGKDKFSNVVWGVIKSLSLNGGNSMSIQNGWKSIYSMIETKLKSYNSYELGTEEYELADKIINQRNNVAIKRVAYYYHQLIQNALTTGITTAVNQYPTDSVFMAGKTGESFVADSYTTSIQTDFQRATQLAKKIQKQHCILNNKNVAESVNFQRKLTGTGNRASNVNPYCVDIDTLEVYGADSNGEPLDNRSSEVLTEVRDLQIEVVKDTIELSKEVAKRRMEVEASLSMVLRDLDGSDFLKSIRQQGFMVMPTYMMKVSREIRNNEFYFEALIKSGNFLPIKTDSNFVAESISGLNSTADFEPYINHSNVFAKLQNQYSDSVYANSSQYVVSVIENNEEELYKGNQTFKEIYSTLFQSPFNRFEQAIGVYDIKNHKDFNAKSCSEVSDLCPIPVNDPIIELNQFGHFLIKNSIAFFGISAGLNASMSTKTLLDDRKAKKAAKKKVAKKASKKVTKKKVAKKPTKKVVKKKAAKKASKKVTKKKVAKKPTKKVVKKKATKKASKKVTKKKVTKKPAKKPVAKKTPPPKPAKPVKVAKSVAVKKKAFKKKLIKPRKLTAFDKKQYKRLLDLRDQLIDATSNLAKDTLKSQGGSDQSGSGQHTADAGSDAYDRDIALNILSKEQDALYEIQEAIRRIERGVYGYCEISGERINKMRLEYIPFCRLTIEQQERWETKFGKERFRRSDEPGYTGAKLD